MALVDNFVNFLTLNIDYNAVESALEKDSSLLDGSDKSTMGFTKYSWMLYVAEDMKRTGDNVDWGRIASFKPSNIELSVDGLNTIQQLIIANSLVPNYDFESVREVFTEQEIISMIKKKDVVDIVQYVVKNKMLSALVQLKDFTDTESYFSTYEENQETAFETALKQYLVNPSSEINKQILQQIVDSITIEDIPLMLHNKDGEMSVPCKNNISGIICTADIQSIVELFNNEPVMQIIKSCDLSGYTNRELEAADGFGDGDIKYSSLGLFPGYGISHYIALSQKEKLINALSDNAGFNEVFFELPSSKNFHSAGEQDGYSLYGMLCESIKIKDDKWTLTIDSKIVAENAIEQYALMGTVRAITSASINLYGPANLLLISFMNYHKKLYDETDKTVGPDSMDGIEDICNNMLQKFGDKLDFEFYRQWKKFFSKEIA